MTMNKLTEEQLHRLLSTVGDRRIPDDVEREIYADIQDATAALRRRSRDGALARYISGYVRDEKHAESSGDREYALCTCSDNLCPLKRGEMPAELHSRDDTIFDDSTDAYDRVTRYLERHDGGEAVEEALREWEREGAEITEILHKALADARAAIQEYSTSDIDPDNVPT